MEKVAKEEFLEAGEIKRAEDCQKRIDLMEAEMKEFQQHQ